MKCVGVRPTLGSVAAHARASVTRQALISAAVDLFNDHGYSETSLNDITRRAHTTSGAFYYHFRSKEALASVLIDEGWSKAQAAFAGCNSPASSGLENVLEMTFALSHLIMQDKSVWIGFQLSQAMGQLSEDGRLSLRQRSTEFLDGVTDCLARSDIRTDVDPGAVASMAWLIVHGCQTLSNLMIDNVFVRLAQSWRLVLPSVAPAESLPQLEEHLRRMAVRFGPSVGHPQPVRGL